MDKTTLSLKTRKASKIRVRPELRRFKIRAVNESRANNATHFSNGDLRAQVAPAPKILNSRYLIQAGFSVGEAKVYMRFSPMYCGDIAKFVAEANEIMRASNDAEHQNVTSASRCRSFLDAGTLRAELDYNGDLLTALGYEFNSSAGRY